jgi:hypothetical protein
MSSVRAHAAALAAALSLAPAARADVPAGHVYVGAGGFLSFATGSRADLALSLELTVEVGRFLVGASGLYQTWTNGPLETAWLGLRAGYIMSDGPTAPFVALAAGGLAQQLITTGDQPFDRLSGSGLAFAPEFGVLLFRDQRWSRLSLSGQLILPTFPIANSDHRQTQVTVFLLGARLQL